MGVDVVLQRDAVSKPWGFRLQGGRESQAPLTIQRVFVGSISDGRLQRGDVITAINGYDATQMYHRDADQLIQQSRNGLTLSVQRGGNSYAESPAAADPSYYKASGSWPGSERDGDEEDYTNRSVAQRREKFASPPADRQPQQQPGVIHMNPKPGMPSYVPKRPAIWHKSAPVAGGLMDPGWAPHLDGGAAASRHQQQAQQSQYHPAHYNERRSPPVNRVQPPRQNVSQERHEPPAWAGSLKRSGGVKTWEMEESESLARGGAPLTGKRHTPPRVTNYAPPTVYGDGGGEPVTPHNPRLQTVRYGPGGGSTYEQHDAARAAADSAKVAHLQYNSPIGLYSRDNASAALQAQTGGKAGQGTLQITGDGRGAIKAFDPTHSDVLRMVAEEDHGRSSRQHPPARSSSNTRSQQQMQRYYDDGGHQQQQHRSQRGVQSQFAEMGISDF